MKGSELLVKSLEEQGVKHIFGIPGNHVLGAYDALLESRIKTILGTHEPSLGYMADGYGRIKQEPGVALVTAGPGALNTVNSIAQAYVESSPVVLIGSYCDLRRVGRGGYHELEHPKAQINIYKEITKWQKQVEDPSEIPDVISKAFGIASEGRKRPVYVEIPENVFDMDGADTGERYTINKRTIDSDKISRAVELIESAQRPVIFAGGGVISSGAGIILGKFAEYLDIPVATTAMGKNAIPETSSHSLGCGIGAIGSDIAREILADADLMIAVGTRFDEVGTGFFTLKVPEKLIHIDIDEKEIGRNYRPNLAIVGDAREVLDSLLQKFQKKGTRPKFEQRIARIRSAKERETKESTCASSCEKINPYHIIDAIVSGANEDAVLLADAGNSSLWLLDYFMPGNQRIITPAAYNSMGFALPAAIGAKIASPSKDVVAVCGDGSFLMTGMELITAVRYGLDITVVVLHDKKYNILSMFQKLKFEREHSDVNLDTLDFGLFAESLGILGLKCQISKDIKGLIDEAISHKGPSLVEVSVDESELPMISKRINMIFKGNKP